MSVNISNQYMGAVCKIEVGEFGDSAYRRLTAQRGDWSVDGLHEDALTVELYNSSQDGGLRGGC